MDGYRHEFCIVTVPEGSGRNRASVAFYDLDGPAEAGADAGEAKHAHESAVAQLAALLAHDGWVPVSGGGNTYYFKRSVPESEVTVTPGRAPVGAHRK
jgi:hypothetical protein